VGEDQQRLEVGDELRPLLPKGMIRHLDQVAYTGTSLLVVSAKAGRLTLVRHACVAA
jgi:hypothetical protein